MREADVANGENPDETGGAPDGPTSREEHRTGPEQARENQANDPPA